MTTRRRPKPATTASGKPVALTDTHDDRLHFEEEMTLLGIDSKRVFRQAISIDADMPDMPDIETEAAEAAGGLDKAIFELDEACAGNTDVDAALAAWKEQLASVAEAS